MLWGVAVLPRWFWQYQVPALACANHDRTVRTDAPDLPGKWSSGCCAGPVAAADHSPSIENGSQRLKKVPNCPPIGNSRHFPKSPETTPARLSHAAPNAISLEAWRDLDARILSSWFQARFQLSMPRYPATAAAEVYAVFRKSVLQPGEGRSPRVVTCAIRSGIACVRGID